MKKDIRRDIKKSNNKSIVDRERIQNDEYKYIRNGIRDTIEKESGKNDSKDSLENYDESMTINAVGRLIGKSSKKSNESQTSTSQMSASQAIQSAFSPDFNKEFGKNSKKEDHREGLYNSTSNYTDTIKLSNLSIPKSRNERPEFELPSRRNLSEPYSSPSKTSAKPSIKSSEKFEKTEKMSNNLSSTTSSRLPTRTSQYNSIDDDEDDYEELIEDEIKPVSALRVIVFSSFLLLLCILVFLVLRINDVTRQLDRMQDGTFPLQSSVEVEALISQNASLTQQIFDLENEISSLHHQMNSLGLPEFIPQSTYINGNQEQILSGQPTPTTGSITHIVQPGQSLSSISSQFFGNPGEYHRIVDANNLQTTELQIGQVLLIPE